MASLCLQKTFLLDSDKIFRGFQLCKSNLKDYIEQII